MEDQKVGASVTVVNLAFVAGAWLAAACLLVADLGAVAPRVAVIFPLGLAHVTGILAGAGEGMFLALLLGGWVPYIALTMAAVLIHRRRMFFAVFGVLCVLLLVDVVGCHFMVRQMKSFHQTQGVGQE